jgi:ribosome biogenesis GTPase A
MLALGRLTGPSGSKPFTIIKWFSTISTADAPLEKQTRKLINVAIIGVPNAGKSTLINNLIDRKVKHHFTKI